MHVTNRLSLLPALQFRVFNSWSDFFFFLFNFHKWRACLYFSLIRPPFAACFSKCLNFIQMSCFAGFYPFSPCVLMTKWKKEMTAFLSGIWLLSHPGPELTPCSFTLDLDPWTSRLAHLQCCQQSYSTLPQRHSLFMEETVKVFMNFIWIITEENMIKFSVNSHPLCRELTLIPDTRTKIRVV